MKAAGLVLPISVLEEDRFMSQNQTSDSARDALLAMNAFPSLSEFAFYMDDDPGTTNRKFNHFTFPYFRTSRVSMHTKHENIIE